MESPLDNRPIRLGMVGGGQGAFIGAVHRIASRIDGEYELVAGCFSSTPEKSAASGLELGVAADRTYADFKQMAIHEARLKNGVEAVAIVTPNNVHFTAAREFLKRGIHVICDKPLTSTLPDAKKFVKEVEKSKSLFVLTHNYTGYPMVRQAREMVSNGDLGDIRLVQVEYPQDWLTEAEELGDNQQAAWRTDPERSGAGGCIGDIGTHAYNLATFVSGLELESVCADLQSFVPGRRLDDNAHVMMRFEGGARGLLWSSQVALGNENGLKLRVYGTKGGLEWAQEDPNYLWFTPFGEPKRLITRGGSSAGTAANRLTRTPGGHPEGYLEGFANIYAEAARAIIAKRNNESVSSDVIYPSVYDGLAGMHFIDACVRSSARNGAWIAMPNQRNGS
ncbi:oxidoreductase [Rhodobacterales bacterium 52_120_T64]|nr:oxidoreductase [Rhodobacterales bacterium 52_120_T64]